MQTASTLPAFAVTPQLRTGIVAFVIVAVAVMIATEGNVLLALLPLLLAGAVVALWRAPLGLSTTVLLAAVLTLDDVRSRPYMGLWHPPWFVISRLVYDGLEKTLGVPGLKIFGVEAVLCLLVLLLVVRSYFGFALPRPAPVFLKATWIATGVVVWLELWGLATGGNGRFSMLQMRPLLFTTLGGIVFAYCLASARDVRRWMSAILAVGVVRVLFGLYFRKMVLTPAHYERLGELGGGMYVTTHADTVLWVTGLVICIVWVFEQPTFKSWLLFLGVGPVLLLGIVINNRRLAIVALVFGLMAIYGAAAGHFRRRVHQLFAYGLPLVLGYVVTAWSSTAGWAKPIQVIRSVLSREDSSSEMRDIENFNLVVTLKAHPLLGWGFGHEYIEFVRAYSISERLEAYRYIPHNSLLGFATITGYLGFAVYWGMFIVGVFLAVRLYRVATDELDRVLGLVGLSVMVTYWVQGFGDIGFQTWMSVLVLSSCLGLIASRAQAVGAFPEPEAA
jgi:hypothetical protein